MNNHELFERNRGSVKLPAFYGGGAGTKPTGQLIGDAVVTVDRPEPGTATTTSLCSSCAPATWQQPSTATKSENPPHLLVICPQFPLKKNGQN